MVIRRELTVGQQRELVRAMRDPDGTIDQAQYPIARALAYLVAWSFVDAHGTVAPISLGALEFLETATLTEITLALNAHEAAIEQEKKQTTSTAPAADPTLQFAAL